MEKGDVYKRLAELTQDFHQRVGNLLRELDHSVAGSETTREQIEGLRKQAIVTGIAKSAWDIAGFSTYVRDEQRFVLFDNSTVEFSLDERKSQLNFAVRVRKNGDEFQVRSEKKKHWLPDESTDYVEIGIMHTGRAVLVLEADLQYGNEIQRSSTKVLGYIPGKWEVSFRELAIGIEVMQKEVAAARMTENERKRLEEDKKRFGLDE